MSMPVHKQDSDEIPNPISQLEIPPLEEIDRERKRLIGNKETKMITIMIIVLVILMVIAVILAGLLTGFLPEEKIGQFFRQLFHIGAFLILSW